MFAMHSLSATKIAPLVGAVLGFAVGAVTVKLRGLALSAGMEEYKAAGKGGSLEEGARLYVRVALNFAAVISIIEAPILFFSKASAPIVLPVGWVVLAACLFYRVWRLNTERVLSNDLDVFKFVAGPTLIGMAGGALYLADISLFSPAADDVLTLIKFEFIANPCAAFGAAAIAILGMGVVGLFAELINSEKYQ